MNVSMIRIPLGAQAVTIKVAPDAVEDRPIAVAYLVLAEQWKAAEAAQEQAKAA